MRSFSSLLAAVILGMLSLTEMGSAQLHPYANGTCVSRRAAETNVTRRNLTDLIKHEDEVQRLRDVFAALTALDKTNPEKNCTYFNVAKHHGWFTATCQHETTTCFQHGFLPWHRVYMYEMEQAMRTIDPNISLPYWDFTSIYPPNGSTPIQNLLPSIVTEQFYFNKKTNRTEYNPLYSYRIPSIEGVNGSPPSPGANITRSEGPVAPISLDVVRGGIRDAFQQNHFDKFSRQFECPHNTMHVFIGGYNSAFTASFQAWTSFDPLFWFYHANIDRIWAGWELDNDDFTSAFVQKTEAFFPFMDWTFEQVSDYNKTMYYTYDHPFKVTDFVKHPGEKALVAQFTKLPISENPYFVRLIVDPHRLTGNASANTILTNQHIVGEIGMWGVNQVNPCQSKGCSAWCPQSIDLSPSQLNLDDFDHFFSQPFDVSNALFLDVYGKGQDPIDLASGIASNDLRDVVNDRQKNLCSTRRKRDCNDACLPPVPDPQISYGTVLSKDDFLNLVHVSDDQKSVLIKWHPISPLQAEYPPINVAPGANLTFHYDVAYHSVAQVFQDEFQGCYSGIMPHCLPKPGVLGDVNCTIQLPNTDPNDVFFFICTQTDHCRSRGMRIRVKVGDGVHIPCLTPQASECADRPCPANAQCRLQHGTIIYTCNPGYQLHGFTTSICQKDGLWTSDPPVCLPEAECAGRTCPDHATCTPSEADKHSSGTTIVYQCDDGYTLDGASVSLCSNGVWKTDVPKCHLV